MTTSTTNNDMKQAGGYLKEKFAIGVSRITKDEVSRALFKVTSHKLKAPNEKHMVRLIAATLGSYNAGSAKYDDVNQYIVDDLEKHLHQRNWVVVLKTLIVLHRLMTEGSPDVSKKIEQNRNLFVLRHQKELADSPGGAQQTRFIQQYTRYLEERCCCHRALGLDSRIESPGFQDALQAMDIEQLTPAFDALLLAADAVSDVEYDELIVDNAATHDAFTRVLQDAARLYVVTAERLVFVLHTFETYPVEFKEKWVSLFKRADVMQRRLQTMFNGMKAGKIVFEATIPTIDTMPSDVIKRLEEDVEFSSVPTESLSSIINQSTLDSMKQKEEEAIQQAKALAQQQLLARQQSDLLSGTKSAQEQPQQPQQAPVDPSLAKDFSFGEIFSAPPATQQPAQVQPAQPQQQQGSPFNENQSLDLFSQGNWGGSQANNQPQFGAPHPGPNFGHAPAPAPAPQAAAPPAASFDPFGPATTTAPPAPVPSAPTQQPVQRGISDLFSDVPKQPSPVQHQQELFGTAPTPAPVPAPAPAQPQAGGFDPFADVAPVPEQQQHPAQPNPQATMDFFSAPSTAATQQPIRTTPPPQAATHNGQTRAW